LNRWRLACLAVLAAAPGLDAQDAYHPPPRDTLDAAVYEGWKQFSINCARCHGDEAAGTSFGPNLLASLRPDGPIPTREVFVALLTAGRPDRGMPGAATLGLSPDRFDGLYAYLSGRSSGRLHGGRPARRAP
jgi:mono/diheme cytochrome c family protein